jgi:hypothetical protein
MSNFRHLTQKEEDMSDATQAAQDPNTVENVRLTIAKQGTIEQGIAGLLRAVSNIIRHALDNNDRTGLVSLAKSFDEDPKQWADAIQANTVAAVMTAGSFAHVPTYVQDAFAAPGSGGWQEQPNAPPHDEGATTTTRSSKSEKGDKS